MKLQMHPVVIEITETDEVVVAQAGDGGTVRITVEQVPFLVELLHQAKAQIEDRRYRRASSQAGERRGQ